MDEPGSSLELRRELGLLQAVLMGLGSIVGTGIFVSIGIAAGATGASVVLAIPLAALVATCNALSSAQLAAAHPVSGGTYEYGYRLLHPWLGFSAGWMFLCAKSASAATAALGFSGYALHALGVGGDVWLVFGAVAIALGLTFVVAAGMRQASGVNTAIVSFTWIALVLFVIVGIFRVPSAAERTLSAVLPDDAPGFLEAAALMFVAFTGYGRIATLGEEVRDPRRTIPRAIVLTLVLAASLYVAVGFVSVGSYGAPELAEATLAEAAPLEIVAESFGTPWLPPLVALAAMTAMLGVLLNLVLGLSRVLLALARRGDAPSALAKLNRAGTAPIWAVIAVGAVVAGLAATGDVGTTWSFSAFTVLVYYAITNLAALMLPPEDRLYPRAIAWGGLGACLFLAFWVEPAIWTSGLALLGIGMLWRVAMRRLGSGRGAD